MNSPSNFTTPTQSPQILRIFGVLMSLLLERSAFYALRSVMVIWAVRQLELPSDTAIDMYSYFILAVYVACIPGALLADLTKRPALMSTIGLAIQALSCLCFLIQTPAFFYIGLAFMALGSGLSRPAMFSMFIQLFQGAYRYLAVGFTILMIFINLGADTGSMLSSFQEDLPSMLFFVALAALLLAAIVPSILNYKYLKSNLFGSFNYQNTFTEIKPLVFLLIVGMASLFWFINTQLQQHIEFKKSEFSITIWLTIGLYVAFGLLAFLVNLRAEINILIGIGFLSIGTFLHVINLVSIADSHYFFLPVAEVFFLVGIYTWVGQYAHPQFRALLFSGLFMANFLPTFFMKILRNAVDFRIEELPLLVIGLVFTLVLAITFLLLTFLEGTTHHPNS